jgi:hypothetical protein
MCCLPNKFPLPIYLLINKCDQLDRVKRSPWMEKLQLENYIKENQFYNHFLVTSERNSNMLEPYSDSFLSNLSVNAESTLRSMIKTILQFKDLKEKLLNMSAVQVCKNKTDKSLSDSSYNNSSYSRDDIQIDLKQNKSKSSHCLIL